LQKRGLVFKKLKQRKGCSEVMKADDEIILSDLPSIPDEVFAVLERQKRDIEALCGVPKEVLADFEKAEGW